MSVGSTNADFFRMATAAVSEDDSVIDKLCDMCQREETTSLATTWCYDCSDALCDQCKGFHKRMKLAAKHRTVPINDVTEREIAASQLNIDMNCDLHPGKLLDLFCEEHSKFCCSKCDIDCHRECKTVISMDDIAQKAKEKEPDRIKEFKTIRTCVNTSIQDTEVELSKLDKGENSLLAGAFDLVKTAKENLNKCYAKFENIVRRKYEKSRNAHNESLKALREFHVTVEKCTNEAELLCHAPPMQSVVMMEKLRQEVEKQYTHVTAILKKDSNVKFKFNPHSTLKLIVDTLSNIGDVEEETEHLQSMQDLSHIEDVIKALDVKLLMATSAQHPVNRQDLLTSDVRLVKVLTFSDLNMKVKPWFYDGTFVNDKDCLFTDYNNSRLVLLNEDLHMKNEIKVEVNPFGFTLSQDKKGVYVVCCNGTVLLYSLNEENKVIRSMNVESNACGIVVCGDTMITGHDNRVILYDMQGNKKQTVSTHEWVSSLVLTNNASMFYHGDGSQVCCRDVNTFKENFRCDINKLTKARGISQDANGNIYIVGYQSHNIHQISHDGSSQRVLIKKMNNIVEPWAIVFHPTRPMFIITSCKEDVAMEVYEFL